MKSVTQIVLIAVVLAIAASAIYCIIEKPFDDNGYDEDDWRNHVGETTTFETRGYQETYEYIFPSRITWTGTAINTLLYMNEDTGYWYINYYTKNLYNGIYEQESSSDEWGFSEDYHEETIQKDVEFQTKYYGVKVCNIVVLKNDVTGHTETQYQGVDDGIVYHVVADTVTGIGTKKIVTHVEMDYKESGKRSVSVEFGVDLYSDDGITVTGQGTYKIGENVTVTASGDDFYGWYDYTQSLDGPISTSKSYTFKITGDTALFAMGEDVDKSITSGEEVTLSVDKELSETTTWTVVHFDRTVKAITETTNLTGSAPLYTFVDPGDYILIIKGTLTDDTAYNGCRMLYVDGYRTNTFSFEFDEQSIEITLNILFSDYVEFMDKTDPSERHDNYKDRSKDARFVVVDKYIEELVTYFKELQKQNGWTDIETADAILAFAQYIEYKEDYKTHNMEEYWNYPVETLYLMGGDCEDTSILCCSIYKAMGYESCFLLMKGHAAVGLLGKDLSGYEEFAKDHDTFATSGYYFGETTSTLLRLGDIPASLSYVDKVEIHVEKE